MRFIESKGIFWRESIFQVKAMCKQVRENMVLSVNKNKINVAEEHSNKSCLGHAESEMPVEPPKRAI